MTVRRFRRAPFAVPAVVLAALAVSCGKGSDGTGPSPTPTSTVDYKLTTRSTSGVNAAIASGEYVFPPGTTVPYSFSIQSAFENLRVIVDGSVVPNTGSVKMDGDHSLLATADLKVVVPTSVAPEVEALATIFRGLATGVTRPMDAYRATLDAVLALSAKAPEDSVSRYLRLARVRGFKTADAETIARAIREIGDSLSVQPRASLAAFQRMTTASTSATSDVIYVYINGINTTLEGNSLTSQFVLPARVRSAGYSDPSKYSVIGYYNPTANPDDINDLAVYVCLGLQGDQQLEGAAATADPLCTALAVKAFGNNDLKEAYLQVLARSLKRVPATPTAAKFADSLTAILRYSRVVVVAHSQGNLFTSEAYRELERRSQVNPRCIGTISLAPPLPIVPLANSAPISARFVAGQNVKDILLKLAELKPDLFPGTTSTPANPTYLSDAEDALYAASNTFWGLLALSFDEAKRQLTWGGAIALHQVNEDYLTANKAIALAAIQEQTEAVLKNCVSGLSFPTSIGATQVGQALPPFDVNLLAPNGTIASKAAAPVTASLRTNAAQAQLSGSLIVSAVNGIARFTNLRIDKAGSGYTLAVTAPGSATAVSPPFDVTSGVAQASVSVVATDPTASEIGADVGTFTVNRTGSTSAALPVNFTLTGTATNGVDYTSVNTVVTIPLGQTSTTVQISPLPDAQVEGTESVNLTLADGGYTIGSPSMATVTIADGNSSSGDLANGENRTGTISASGEVDTLRFTASQGDAIVLSMGAVGAPSTFVPWIRLASPTGSIISEDRNFIAARIQVTATTSGTYTVIIADFGAGSISRNYVITLAKAPGTFIVPTGDEGGPMTNGANHAGSIPGGDLDQWTFTAAQGDAIVLSMGAVASPSNFVPWIRLVSPTGAIISEDHNFIAARIQIAAPESGTYTVIVADFGASSIPGNYLLTLAKAPGTFVVPTGDEGGPMTNGANHAGSIPVGDLDQWTFSAAKGDAIVLSIGAVASSSTFVPWIRLVSPTGTVIGDDRNFTTARVQVTAPTSGTYTVIVADFGANSNSVGNYLLILAKAGP